MSSPTSTWAPVSSPRNLNRRFSPIRERLGPEVRFHDLRHTCVTLLPNLGIPPRIVRDIVGHSAPDVTMAICAPRRQDGEADRPGPAGEPAGRRVTSPSALPSETRNALEGRAPLGRSGWWRPRQDSNLRPSA
ncbi:tyrosine-type recombinase/integrase [Streptomyces sp. NBC_01635]|uniref:tyrosine-type recombinase/integrase n=1 Tax=Streptomyces sp. NBC_01635 TaxID=2975904 RepID=UPI0038638660|nr:tyrosine-type recombinase/integrase [Streptomyces sp. NBC_01635]